MGGLGFIPERGEAGGGRRRARVPEHAHLVAGRGRDEPAERRRREPALRVGAAVARGERGAGGVVVIVVPHLGVGLVPRRALALVGQVRLLHLLDARLLVVGLRLARQVALREVERAGGFLAQLLRGAVVPLRHLLALLALLLAVGRAAARRRRALARAAAAAAAASALAQPVERGLSLRALVERLVAVLAVRVLVAVVVVAAALAVARVAVVAAAADRRRLGRGALPLLLGLELRALPRLAVALQPVEGLVERQARHAAGARVAAQAVAEPRDDLARDGLEQVVDVQQLQNLLVHDDDDELELVHEPPAQRVLVDSVRARPAALLLEQHVGDERVHRVGRALELRHRARPEHDTGLGEHAHVVEHGARVQLELGASRG